MVYSISYNLYISIYIYLSIYIDIYIYIYILLFLHSSYRKNLNFVHETELRRTYLSVPIVFSVQRCTKLLYQPTQVSCFTCCFCIALRKVMQLKKQKCNDSTTCYGLLGGGAWCYVKMLSSYKTPLCLFRRHGQLCTFQSSFLLIQWCWRHSGTLLLRFAGSLWIQSGLMIVFGGRCLGGNGVLRLPAVYSCSLYSRRESCHCILGKSHSFSLWLLSCAKFISCDQSSLHLNEQELQEWIVSTSVAAWLYLCFLLMLRFCWLHQIKSSGTDWDSLKPRVMWFRLGFARLEFLSQM